MTNEAEERDRAEYEYSITAFDYQKDPVGSRDWTLFWKGWQAARAASPVSARDLMNAQGKVCTLLARLEVAENKLQELGYVRQSGKDFEGYVAVAPVSAEQPTITVGHGAAPGIASPFWGKQPAPVYTAAPSVAEDSATQPVQTCTRPAPHICKVNGPCNGWPSNGITAPEDCYVAYCRYTERGTIVTCDSDAPKAFKVYRHPASRPGSEDWMRKAAEEYLRQAHPDLMADMVDELSSIIAKHYAASQLSTEKK